MSRCGYLLIMQLYWFMAEFRILNLRIFVRVVVRWEVCMPLLPCLGTLKPIFSRVSGSVTLPPKIWYKYIIAVWVRLFFNGSISKPASKSSYDTPIWLVQKEASREMLAPDWSRLNGPKNAGPWLVQAGPENAGSWLVQREASREMLVPDWSRLNGPKNAGSWLVQAEWS